MSTTPEVVPDDDESDDPRVLAMAAVGPSVGFRPMPEDMKEDLQHIRRVDSLGFLRTQVEGDNQ